MALTSAQITHYQVIPAKAGILQTWLQPWQDPRFRGDDDLKYVSSRSEGFFLNSSAPFYVRADINVDSAVLDLNRPGFEIDADRRR